MSIQDHSVCPRGQRQSRRIGVKSGLLVCVAIACLLIQSGAMAQDGIQVHGDWEVVVTNPDGSVAQRRLFSNALVSTGGVLLVGLMAGKVRMPIRANDSQPAWNINAWGNNIVDSEECRNIHGSSFSPMVTSPRNASADLSDPYSLVLSRTLILESDCIIGESYSITRVSANYTREEFETGALGTAGFSSKVLDTAITGILPGQSVLLKVNYSFE